MLSKSRYLSGVQCEKRLYWEVHDRESLPEAEDNGFIRAGHEVGRVATERYPGGVRIEEDHLHHEEAMAATRRAMADRAVPAIFEAAFQHRGIKVRVDILARTAKGWRIEEVKSSSRVKERHELDLAVQLYVLDSCGVRVTSAGILHLNSEYVRRTQAVDLAKLFTFVELRRKARKRAPEVAKQARRFMRVLRADEAPAIEGGDHCTAPYVCPFFERCNPPLAEFSVRQLPRSWALARKLAARGVDDLRHIPEDVELSRMQQRARDGLISKREVASADLDAVLRDVSFPLYFVDFETVAPAIPRYRHTGVYRQIPFQWSVHRLEADGSLHHEAFLHDEDSDPRARFAESLVAALGTTGSIVVYSSFEASRIAELARAVPAHRRALNALRHRLWDLYEVLCEHYYHPDMGVSFSLKAVVPAVVPALSYDDLEIGDGNLASEAYVAMIAKDCPPAEKARLRAALLAYCERDTRALVEVRRALLLRTSA